MGGPSQRHLPALSCVAFVLLGAAAPGTAQTLRGIVVSDAGDPVAGAVITLLAPDDAELSATLSDPMGVFELRAPAPGAYRLRVYRIGFQERISGALEILDGQISSVRIVLSTRAIEIEGLEVEVPAPVPVDARLARRGYYERWELYGRQGWGRFLGRPEIEASRAFHVTELLRSAPGMRVRPAGGRRTSTRCRNGAPPRFYLDGHEMKIGDDEIDSSVIPSDLVAVEIYAGTVSPIEFNHGRGCAVALWTGVYARNR